MAAILVALSIVFAAIVILGTALLLEVRRLGVQLHTLETELSSLRLKSRARIATASMQSGATSDEQKLVRLGRASIARRVVFGGDDDSQLNQDLKAGLEAENDG